MNYYYVDPSQNINGNGSKESPFNSMDALVSSGVSFPYTIYIKRGTTFSWSYQDLTTNSIFYNTSTTQSHITSYGEGKKPIWFSMGLDKRHLYSSLMNVAFHDLQISPPPGGEFTGGYLYGVPYGNTANSNLCNLEFYNLDFIGTPESIGGSVGSKEISMILLLVDNGGANNIAHKIYIHDIYADHVNCGIFVRGNPHLSDTTTYRGDQKKSYGVRVIDVSFTNIINYGVLLAGCASKNKNRNVRTDDMESGFDGIYYSSYKTNVYNPNTDPYGYTTARYDVPLWMTMCSYVTGQNFEVHGSGPGKPDRYALDFDWHCNNCLMRWGYTTNNAKSFMFIQGPFSNSWYSAHGYTPLSTDPYTLYYTYGAGCYDNVYEYILSYNDGIGRTKRSEDIYWRKAAAYRYCYNNTARNIVFIDTVSTENDYILTCNPQTDDNTTANSMLVDSCIFYWKNRNATSLISQKDVDTFGTLMTKFKFSNNIFYSEKWGSSTPSLPGVTTESNYFIDPEFNFMPPKVPPAGLKEAIKIISLSFNSPAIGTGTVNSNKDISGKSGNNIGWEQ